MKQQCYLVAIYLNWVILAGGMAYLLYRGFYGMALAWLVLVPLGMRMYVRVFPSISQAMGYGKVEDRPAHDFGQPPATVTLYTALGCPFCPIVKDRLNALRKQENFTIEEVDVTLRPGILAANNIRAVPVVEAAGRRINGNATSEELANLIYGTLRDGLQADSRS